MVWHFSNRKLKEVTSDFILHLRLTAHVNYVETFWNSDINQKLKIKICIPKVSFSQTFFLRLQGNKIARYKFCAYLVFY